MKTKPIFWTDCFCFGHYLCWSSPCRAVAQDANQSAPPASIAPPASLRRMAQVPAAGPDGRLSISRCGNPPPAAGDPRAIRRPQSSRCQASASGSRHKAGPQLRPRYAPTTITLPAGTWVTVRVNEPLSSDHNQTGDAFTGTLLEPIIANGLLIARRGETVTGIVIRSAESRTGVGRFAFEMELTGIQLADGRQIQVKTKLIDRRGNTSYGRDAVCHRRHHRQRARRSAPA